MRNRRRKNWVARLKLLSSLLIIASLGVSLWFLTRPQVIVYTAEPAPVVVVKPVPKPAPKKVHYATSPQWTAEQETSIKAVLQEHFAEPDAKIALAIIKHESRLSLSAKNWNCFYDSEGLVHEERNGNTVSRSCQKGHRQYAWSVDCGVMQYNVRGKDCPEFTQDREWSITKMKEMHAERGWQPWVAYTSGAYRKYL